MHHEALRGFAFEPVETLNIFRCSKSRSNQCLGLAAGKNGRAVSSRKHPSLDPDWADRIELPFIRPFPLAKNLVAEDFFLEPIEDAFDHLQLFIVFGRFWKQFDGLFLGGIYQT